MGSGAETDILELGVFRPQLVPVQELAAGEVGYIATGLKSVRDAQVGDTVTDAASPASEPLPGYLPAKSLVFAGIYPISGEDYPLLRDAMEKLHLNDASFTFEAESSIALGFGFRCGFLGLLHMEIVQERLEREFDMDVITTVPNVSFKAYTTKGEEIDVHNPSGLPPVNHLERIEEPYIIAQVITLSEYVGSIMNLCIDKRGVIKNQVYLTRDRVELTFEMPLAEIVFDFYYKLKSISKGYASFDYYYTNYQKADLVRLDILLNGEMVDACLLYTSDAADEEDSV